VSDAQDAAVRAAMSGSGGAGARLRKLAEDTRDRINQFDKDVDQDTNRLEQSRISLAAKQRAIRDARGMIVRRLNTMSSLAERAGVEFGTELFAQHSQPQQSQRMALPRATRRRPRRVRVRRRRAS
ncbi:MAG: hypothetical protein QF357_05955, partial [Dehalococcoidia bacterium]|nr:hypothetical protein [Dehalococcoidia bacterium]